MTFLPPGHAPLKFHPLAILFPMLSDSDLDDLAEDIRANGQVETVKLHQGMVLDGRNRYTACARKSLGVRAEIFQGSEREALNWVISKNLKRRHLDTNQRAAVAAAIGKLQVGANQHSKPAQICAPSLDFGQPDPTPASPAEAPMSQADRAELLNVSRRTLQHADVVFDKGAVELRDALRDGEIAASTAAEIAERPVGEQAALLAKLPRDEAGKLTLEAKKEIRKVAKEVRVEDQAEKKKKRDEREAKLGAKIRALPDVKAGLILSDFEWHFKVRSEETGMDRHAANHYVTAREAQTPEAILERQRERMSIAADDCIHLMWCPASFNDIALKVMALQGFTYVSQFCWIKPGIGTGFWVRDKHELLLIGVKGKIPCPAMGDQFDSAIEAAKGEHSEKPDFQYEIAEHYFPSLPKVELNARRPREGWIQWGNEAPEPAQPALGLEPAEAAE
jgi:N6-adenosine-specific RNA methylase IME4